MTKTLGKALLTAALVAMMRSAWPACGVTAQSLVFGSYDVFSNQSVESVGNIAVACDIATPYSISLSPGNGTYQLRLMVNGARVLNYNVYTDATRTTIWGDGSSGTSTVNGNGTSVNHAVYGRIPARQNAYVGSYTDDIIVTVNY